MLFGRRFYFSYVIKKNKKKEEKEKEKRRRRFYSSWACYVKLNSKVSVIFVAIWWVYWQLRLLIWWVYFLVNCLWFHLCLLFLKSNQPKIILFFKIKEKIVRSKNPFFIFWMDNFDNFEVKQKKTVFSFL